MNPHPLTYLKEIDDQESFARLPVRLQKQVIRRMDWILILEEARHGARGEIVKQAAAALEVSQPTVWRFVRGYQKDGWQALIDQRGRHSVGLPEAFENHIKQRHLLHQRSTTGCEVHRGLLEDWALWKSTGDAAHSLPGYDSPPPAGPQGYPVGWSIDTIRRLRPDRYALATVRQGAKRAAKYLPDILSTRHGLAFEADPKVRPRKS